MARYVLTRAAEREIDRIWLSIARHSGNIEVAERGVTKLLDRILLLSAYPASGKRCTEIDPKGRCSPIGNFVIYYREQKGRIQVTHVFHGMRSEKSLDRQIKMSAAHAQAPRNAHAGIASNSLTGTMRDTLCMTFLF
jgi:toxin ParE1/3/4